MWSLTVDGRVSASVISQWLYALLWQNATPFLLVRRIINCIVTELYFTSESSNAFILLFLQHKVKVISSLPWLQKKGEKWKDSPGEKVWFHAQLASSFPVVHLNISIFTNRNWRFVVLHRRTRVLLFVETSMWFHHSTFHVEVNSTDQMLSSILTCHTFHWSISPPIRIQFFQHNFVYSGVQSAWVRFQEDSRDSDS